MNKKKISIVLGVVCFVLAFAVVVQIKTVKNSILISDPTFAEDGLRDEVLKWKERYDNCYAELERADKELEEQRTKASQNDGNATQKEEALKIGNTYLGLTDVTGKGVTITLRDNQTVTSESISATDNLSDYNIHDIDILSIINELKNAGAEAISLNDQRIIPTTSIVCAGNIVQMNGQKVGAPFIIKAIGSQDTLYENLNRPGGYLDNLKSWGITADMKKVNNLTVSKYSGVINYKYLKEVK